MVVLVILVAHVSCWLRCISPQENLLGAFSNLNDFLTLLPEILGFTEQNSFILCYLLIYSVVRRAMLPLFLSLLFGKRSLSNSRILALGVRLQRYFEPRLDVTIRKS